MRFPCRGLASPQESALFQYWMSSSKGRAMWNETRDSVSYSTALQAIAGWSLQMGECTFISQGIANRTGRFTRSRVRCWRISNNSQRFNLLRFMTNSAIRAHPQPALTRPRPVLTQPLRLARPRFPLLRSLQLLGGHRPPYGRPDHFSPERQRRSMDLLVTSLPGLI